MSSVAVPSRSHILSLYKSLMKESKSFASYNFRIYALDRIRYGFRQTVSEKDPQKIAALYQEGEKTLQMIKRQALVNRLFTKDKLVVEK